MVRVNFFGMSCQIAYLIVLALVISSGLFAQDKPQLSGTVTDAQSGLPIAGAEVLLKDRDFILTDDEGHYKFKRLTPGRHTIEVKFSSYQSMFRRIQVEKGRAVVLDFRLTLQQDDAKEVVVSASRAKETLDEVPSAVSILNATQIEQSQAVNVNLAGILSQVPGMAISSGQTKNPQSLRGRNVLALVDGIPQSVTLRRVFHDINSIDPNSLDRIEIIKGATAIYGNGSDGGIINYITKKPKKNKPFSGLTRIENVGALTRFDNGMGGSLYQQFSGKPGKFDYIISGLYRQVGVFYDANAEVISPFYGLGESLTHNVFGKFGYDIAPNQRIEWMTNYYSSIQYTHYKNQSGKYGLRPAIGVLGESEGEPQGTPYSFNTQLKYTARELFHNTTDLDIDLYLQRFRTVVYYNKSIVDPHKKLNGGQSQIKSGKKGLRVNLNTRFRFSDRFRGNLIYGLDLLSDKTIQNLIDGRDWMPELDMRNFAPYAQLKFNIYNNWILKGGIRFENISIRIPDYTTLYRIDKKGVLQGGVSVNGGRLGYNATVFNVGLRYNRFQAFKPFIGFSQSFSISDLGRVLKNPKETDIISKIKPEVKAVIANNYEIGFNSNPNKYFRFSGSAFLSTSKWGASLKDKDGIYFVLRAPEIVYGYEFQADAYPIEGVTVGGSITYIQGKLDDNRDGRYNSYINSLRIPPLKVTTHAQYRYKDLFLVRLSGAFHGERKLFAPNEQGRYEMNEAPVLPITLIDLFASYKLSRHLKIHLGIENLFNADYYTQYSMLLGRDDRYIKGNGSRYSLGLTFDF